MVSFAKSENSSARCKGDGVVRFDAYGFIFNKTEHEDMNRESSNRDMLALSSRRYWHKPAAIFFNALQLRAYQAAGMSLDSPVLDVGCSDGGFGVLLSDALGRPEDMTGIDTMKGALDAAGSEARALYREMLCESATNLPFADNSFRTVMANASLFAINPDLDKAIAEFYRVLQPGGVFYASVCTDQYDQHYWLTRLLNRLGWARFARRYAESMNARMMQTHRFTPKEWQEVIQSGGFVIQQCSGFLSLADTPFWSFLAWTPLRVNGVLRYITSQRLRGRIAAFYDYIFRKRYERSTALLPHEFSGYIFIAAVKQQES